MDKVWMKLLKTLKWGLCLAMTGLLVAEASARNRAGEDPFATYTWTTPSRDASESMPCGGGDVGLNVWVENGDVLMYVSRSGAFDENNTLLKQGRLRLRLSPNPFLSSTDFKQTLHLDGGYIEITSGGVSVQVWADVFSPTVHVEMNSVKPLEATLSYENWRYQDRLVRKTEGQQCSYKWAIPKGCATKAEQVEAEERQLTFVHRNEGNTVFDVAVAQQGLESVKPQLMDPLKNLTSGGLLSLPGFRFSGTAKGEYMGTDYQAWNYQTQKPVKSLHVDLRLHINQTETLQAWKDQLSSARNALAAETAMQALQGKVSKKQISLLLQGKAAVAEARKFSRLWWKQYYQRSYIQSEGESEPMTRNYTLFRYMLGCNAYGAYPTKFNGGLFTFDPVKVDAKQAFTPDYRRWGGGTMTAQNQRLVYWPMLKSGDADLMQAQLDTYLRMLPNAELRSQVYWGHKGGCFGEQIENFGLPNPAEYGFKRPDYFDKGVEYNAWLEYEWDTVLEFCSMALQAHQYENMNVEKYEPLITSALTFFEEHYRYLAKRRGRKELDGDGKLVLFPGSACETYKMTNNSANTVAALQTVLKQYVAYCEEKGDSAVRWRNCLNTIPEIPLRTIQGKQAIAPAKTWERVNNVETPQLYPVFPWRVYGMGRPDLETARNTYLLDADALKFRTHIGWKQDNIWAACLGLTDEAARLMKAKLGDGPHRFPAFWGPGYDWTPDHNWGGSGAIGLQEMLMQENGTEILLFPAWPRAWNVRFRLHASGGTVVEAELRNGEVELLEVAPAERRKDIKIGF